ncbi:MAG: hypothetical protein JHC40_04430, partial [Burkholderiales bacterium]|nr:hypothetical protein [Burkholderiales bacterium]
MGQNLTAPVAGLFPAGLPARLTGAGAWVGQEMGKRSDWIETLSSAELDELFGASEPWLRSDADLTLLRRERFALPRL